MFDWLRERRRKKILESPFKQEWHDILMNKVVHYRYLSDTERTKLQQLTQVFAAEKQFEGCNGLKINDEVKFVISCQACLLVLELPHNLYKRVDSILVYPSTIVSPPQSQGVFWGGAPALVQSTPILGEAHMHGPIILVWDAVQRGAIHPERGHNVVYHEFAHKLDMLDGYADGVPPLHEKTQYQKWSNICVDEFEELKTRSDKGKPTFLDPYGATNEAEFFAVATEFFFDKPQKMKSTHKELYEILVGYYNQDPAKREKAYHEQR